MAEPGAKIVNERTFTDTIDDVPVELTVIEWNDTEAISVDVRVEIDGEKILLTGAESLDDEPDDDTLRRLIADYHADPSAPEYADYN